ncbi:hypothetical protein SDC9_110535 [bioreactor metagenome]|uniref:B box-type domain-containing protein n=1 Tax=bioreactor metagenome TaxID=1076179 RepID=A0A645BPC8_9ZZZZ
MSISETSGPLHCYKHPQRETYLRCNNCNQPICTSCAVLTPTGYRCKDCVRGQQKKFDTTRWWDYPLTAIVAAVLAYLSYTLLQFISFLGYFTLILAPLIGAGIAEAVRFVVRRRRSKALPWVAGGGVVAGMLVFILPMFISMVPLLTYQYGVATGGIYSFASLIFPVGYIILTAVTVYYRLKGIRL